MKWLMAIAILGPLLLAASWPLLVVAIDKWRRWLFERARLDAILAHYGMRRRRFETNTAVRDRLEGMLRVLAHGPTARAICEIAAAVPGVRRVELATGVGHATLYVWPSRERLLEEVSRRVGRRGPAGVQILVRGGR